MECRRIHTPKSKFTNLILAQLALAFESKIKLLQAENFRDASQKGPMS